MCMVFAMWTTDTNSRFSSHKGSEKCVQVSAHDEGKSSKEEEEEEECEHPHPSSRENKDGVDANATNNMIE